jgi:hypothetical protein
VSGKGGKLPPGNSGIQLIYNAKGTVLVEMKMKFEKEQ